ncbi:MAG: alpha-galactosidase [Clostridia bacterium]|nr:alpha-galactosidase [Clostridia bacterium]
MKKIEFGGLTFTVSNDGKVYLTKLYHIDYTKNEASLEDTLVAWNHKESTGPVFCEFDVAGGSSSGTNRLCDTKATAAIRYVSHTEKDGVLTIVQRSDIVEVTSRFESYGDTNAFRVTNTVTNIGTEPLCIEMANTFGFSFADNWETENKDWYFHKFTNARYTESMPDVRSFYDLGFCWKNQVFQVVNVGNASAYENIPQGILENRVSGDFLMFQIESYYDWFYQVTISDDKFKLQLGGPTAIRHAWNKVLAAGESYTTVPAAFSYGKSLNGVLGEMTKYRRHIKAQNEEDRELPSIFNEYMHLSWDDPYESRTRALAPYIAETGCKYYVIDCGWHNSVECNGRIYHFFGTWKEDLGRFPEGIKATADYLNSLGLKLGLWLAPEVVGNENYDMIDYYGDECFLTRNGKKISNDTAYLLDFRQQKVRDYMSATIDRMVNDLGCKYIKFDGCPNAGFGCDRGATSMGDGLEKHIEAFLGWVDEMMKKYPDVIFEDCFGGGMRTDYKALSMFSVISTSDQTRYDHYPYITANIFASVLPEQAAVWSYPVDISVYDPENEDSVNDKVSMERVAINMVNAVLGRIHLASRINLLDAEKRALIREGVDFYDRIREDKLKALPYMPLGYARFGDKHLASGLITDEKLYLAVWNLGGERKINIPLSDVKVKEVKVAFPLSLETKFSYDETSLSVYFTEDYQARIFEITI